MVEVNFNTQRVEATSCQSMDGKKQVEQNLAQVWLPSKWPGSTSGQFLVLKCVTGKDTLGLFGIIPILASKPVAGSRKVWSSNPGKTVPHSQVK